MNSRELIICIPGPWADNSDFIGRLITLEPPGRYMFAGMILADVQDKDHVPLEFCGTDPSMGTAFKIAGQGQVSTDILKQVENHSSVAYLHFPLDLMDQRERILKYTQLLQRIGGIAVKLESAGVAHSWNRWFQLLSGEAFDIYCACVVLIGDEDHYYSCGMHHFGLPECMVPRSIPADDAAELMNQFNFWQIVEHPQLNPGHTFSLSESRPRFRLTLENDRRHEPDHQFHNPNGVWRLCAA
jgi:hypothetical protein